MLGLCIYQPNGLKNKDYNPNIDIITWDLENNSFGWKFNPYVKMSIIPVQLY